MTRPIILIVDDNAQALQLAEQELSKRYGADYEVHCSASPLEALDYLTGCRAEENPVALILANCWMTRMTGVEFLQQARRLHPEAMRALLIDPGDPTVTQTILHATAMGMIDAYGTKPWRPGDENFHDFVTNFLAEWAREHQPHFELVRVIGERWSPRSHELRDLLGRNGIPYGFYEADSAEGQALLEYGECISAPLPALIFADGTVLIDPDNSAVAEALNVKTAFRSKEELVDVVIVGAGPAGLSAAVYGASEGLRTVVLEPEALGGQAGMSSRIRNYLGFPTGLSGAELASRAYRQAWLFGADFIFTQRAVGLDINGDERIVHLSDGTKIHTRAVVLAMGASYRRLDVPGLEELTGMGVFYGAAASEALAMRGRELFIVGGGNSAGQAALHLARFADHVTMLVRGDSLAATMSDYLIKQIEHQENITIRYNTEVIGGGGAHRLEELVLQDTETGRTETLPAAALFVLIGAMPNTEWLPAAVQCDEQGYVITGPNLLQDGRLPEGWPLDRQPFLVETSVPRVFAVGDVRHRSVKRVASAVGEGSIAIQFIHQALE